MSPASPELKSPFEFLDLPNCQTVTLTVLSWDFGTAMVHPPWLPPGELRETEVLRIHVPREQKPLFPHYYDMGQRTLIPQVMALLTAGVPEGYGVRIHAVGTGPKKRFEVSLVPV